MENKIIKTIKGFSNELKCQDMQYEIGKTYELPEGEEVELCARGFHALSENESPLKIFDYYSPSECGNRSRYCEVEVSGDVKSDGSKIAGSRIKIGAEIGIPGLIRAHFEWVKRRITNENNAEPGKPATAGSYGAATAGSYGSATAGSYGAATAGYRGAATAGYRGAATAGDSGAATSRGSVAVGEIGVATVRGNNAKAKGGIGAILTIAEEMKDRYDIKWWKTIVIDGDQYKPDTWYGFKDGEIVELENEMSI